MKKGLLLVNLGTPKSPDPNDVGLYLREFLMDKYVLDIAWPLRWLLVHLSIVPKRKFATGKLYQTIWTDRGSPLLFHLRDLQRRIQLERSGEDLEIEIAMRYGEPSIRSALMNLKKNNVGEITVFSLYPQYAESSTLSSEMEVKRWARELKIEGLRFVPPFYSNAGFIDSYARLVRAAVEKNQSEHVLMSFHGLPERHVKQTDRSTGRTHCLPLSEAVYGNCCETIVASNRDCYRAQCFATARLIAESSGLKRDGYSISFQSRLGRAVWIKPYTDEVIPRLALRGIRRLAVVCPSFVADCLETLEENGIRGAEAFYKAGGDHFTAIPCPNSDMDWARAVSELARTTTS